MGLDIRTIPVEPRALRVTEARLDAIYEAAKAGLTGDSLAFAAGMAVSTANSPSLPTCCGMFSACNASLAC